MSRRRPVVQYAPLTSLLDVLFILVFASLIHSAALERKAAEAKTEPAADAVPEPEPDELLSLPPLFDPAIAAGHEAKTLHRAALAQLLVGLEGRRPVVARVGRDGQLRALERVQESGERFVRELGLPLVERVADPDVASKYLGDRESGLRLCSLLRLQLGVPDLADTLIIVAPDAPLDELSVALTRGLQRDAERCLAEQRGVAVIVDPRAAGAARPEGGSP
jgi:hypothetical protein